MISSASIPLKLINNFIGLQGKKKKPFRKCAIFLVHLKPIMATKFWCITVQSDTITLIGNINTRN
jgi:hypothetical protein